MPPTLGDYVVQDPDPRLRHRCSPIRELAIARTVADDALHVSYEIRRRIYAYPRGFEIAAPQLGHPWRLIVLQGGFAPTAATIESTIMVNPEILEVGGASEHWEDCLSVQDMRGRVERPRELTVRYQDLSGEMQEVHLEGDQAADVQHGVDHLDGNLFFERSMQYLIPNSVYRPFKDKGIDVLDACVEARYRRFDPSQRLTPQEMVQINATHPRQSLPVGL